MSPGMKSRIISGQFEFPPAEWLNVSQEAKELIAGMLETVPDRRLTIKQVMSNKWLLVISLFPFNSGFEMKYLIIGRHEIFLLEFLILEILT